MVETTNKYWLFLENLRRSGETNMYGAAPYLVKEFGMNMQEAIEILVDWMLNYDKANYEGE